MCDSLMFIMFMCGKEGYESILLCRSKTWIDTRCYLPLTFFVWLDWKSRALSCDMAASANAPPLRVCDGFGSALPKFQPWALPRFLIPNFLRTRQPES